MNFSSIATSLQTSDSNFAPRFRILSCLVCIKPPSNFAIQCMRDIEGLGLGAAHSALSGGASFARLGGGVSAASEQPRFLLYSVQTEIFFLNSQEKLLN